MAKWLLHSPRWLFRFSAGPADPRCMALAGSAVSRDGAHAEKARGNPRRAKHWSRNSRFINPKFPESLVLLACSAEGAPE